METLCSACLDMFNGRSRNIHTLTGKRRNVYQDRFEHHLSPWMLEEASKQGCYMCTLIWNSLLPIEHIRLRRAARHKALIRTKQLLRCLWDPALYPDTENYTWHCDFHSTQLVFSFGGSSSWRDVRFDLIHPQGSQNPSQLCMLY